MELSSEGGEIPIPINSAYGGGGNGHMIHHDHYHHHHHAPHKNIIQASSSAPQISSPIPLSTNLDDHQNGSTEISAPNTKMVKYKECLKNHAAAMGGNATDGCGEFMPSGEDGTIEALNCSACNCHRNFHRKEIEGEQQQQQQAITPFDCYYHHMSPHFNRVGRKMISGHHKNNILAATPEALGYRTPTGTLVSSRGGGATVTHPMIMPHNMMGTINPWESDEHEHGVGGGAAMATAQLVKKRSRTKFTQEQKEKMFNFAEKVGWKLQKQEESLVQQLCQEIGVKRRVLKVWMHNNKHNLAKKNNNIININPPPNTTA